MIIPNKRLLKRVFVASFITFLGIALVSLFLIDKLDRYNNVADQEHQITSSISAWEERRRIRRANIEPTFESPDFNETSRRFPWIRPGGLYSPPNCKSCDKVAIIVPFRDRTSHLKTLLLNLHPFLKRQQLEYGIYVLEQVLPGTFNKGKLMNIGYLEVMRRHAYHCVIYHDVDLLPEDDRNIYSCPDQPRHHAAAVDKFSYKSIYTKFGGVTALTREHMEAVNGFSNIFWGWGGEDEEMERRLRATGFNLTEYSMDVSRYKMIEHGRDITNPWIWRHDYLVKTYKIRMPFDGLNSLEHYTVQNIEEFPTHTLIQIYIDEQAGQQSLMYKLFGRAHEGVLDLDQNKG